MKLRRFVNQNRFYIVVAIVVVIFAIVIVQILNSLAKKELEEKSAEKKAEQEQTTTYKKESKSIISDGKVSSTMADKFGDCIKDFLNNCNNGEIEKAYDSLTKNCKEKCFNTIEDFQERYINKIFNAKKQYTFQSWVTGAQYVYQVKIFDDMLSSGKATSNYITDYFTIKQEGNYYKLNINGFIDFKKINKKDSENGIQIVADSVEIYKDYSIYNFSVTNENNVTIMLDGKNKSNSVYIKEDNGVKYSGLIHELNNSDLKIEPNETKNISVKFNIVYRDDLDLESVVFTNIINNYEKFISNKDEYKNITRAVISL